jgi:hypothetical protein
MLLFFAEKNKMMDHNLPLIYTTHLKFSYVVVGQNISSKVQILWWICQALHK